MCAQRTRGTQEGEVGVTDRCGDQLDATRVPAGDLQSLERPTPKQCNPCFSEFSPGI